MVARQTLFEHFTNRARDSFLVARNCVGFLLYQERDVWVLFEGIANAVEVQIKALLAEFGQNRFCR